MGQEQSTPVNEGYQHDFLTAHVKQASAMHTPSKNPLQGFSSVGADSIMLSAAKKMQQNVSGEPPGSSYQGQKSSMGPDAFLLQEMRHIKEDRPIGRAGGAAYEHKPSVPVDSWAMMQAKKAAALVDTKQRNRFNLGASLPEPHSHVDGYETAFYQDTKKLTRGPLGSKGLDSRMYAGVKPIVTGEDIYVKHAKETYGYTLPDRDSNFRGIRPTIPKDAFVAEQLTAKKAAIAEANHYDALPAPQVDSEAYMLRLAKEHARDNPPTPQTFGNPSPFHSYDDSESLMTQEVLKAKELSMATPDRSAYQGIKASLGADTFMMNFSKTVSSFTPNKMRSKEMKTPPAEVRL